MKDNARNHPFLIALGTIAALYALTFAPIDQYRFLGFDLRPVTLPFSPSPVAVATVTAPTPSFSALPVASFAQTTTTPAGTSLLSIGSDTLITAATVSSAASAQTFSPGPALSSQETPTVQAGGLLVDYGTGMQMFHDAIRNYALKSTASGTDQPGMIRIAYVGDSMIEGDVITKDLRAMLQSRFGGQGAGFLKIVAEDAPFRTDMRHTFSDNWTVQALNRDRGARPFWFGPVFITAKESWVSYELTRKNGSDLDCYLLYRGDGGDHHIFVTTNDGPVTWVNLDPTEGIHFTKLYGHGDGALKKVRIEFPEPGITVYGVSFQRDSGIYVDNYSLRGHKGLELAKVSADVAGQMLRYSPYKLIILQFGVNVAYAEADGFRLYERGISGVINHLRQLFPDTAILVVSTSDRCIKEAGEIVSDEEVPELMQAQLRAAAKEGVAFFDLYHAMGGPGAMTEWVKEGYAVKDYTHINRRGGKKIAELLYVRLMEQEFK